MSKQAKSAKKRAIEDYIHKDKKRLNNPPVGLVTSETDRDAPKRQFQYDPHLDPQLIWAAKTEHSSFKVETVSLHVQERIEPRTIIEAVAKNNSAQQLSFFDRDRNEPLRHAIDFYKHKHNWSNRLIAGDSLLVMNSLLEKEGMAGQIQMVYCDPPYGIKYKSNFQPFFGNRNVAETDKDDDLTTEPETIKAFRDTWELGIHSYLSYLRDRCLLARELLRNQGSIFVQISDENLHFVRNILDEVFGSENFISLIAFKKKKMPLGETFIFTMCDYLVWYAKDKKEATFNRLFIEREAGDDTDFNYVELDTGETLTIAECKKKYGSIPKSARYFQSMDMRSSGRTEGCIFDYEFEGERYFPSGGKSWKTNLAGMDKLKAARRLFAPEGTLRYKYFYDDFPVKELSHLWTDTQGATDMTYVVQTSEKVIQRCMLMVTNPGELVFDPTCGSGTTAAVAERWGRRWITCDTSRVAITLAKQRIMTEVFPYFRLAQPEEGVGSGFIYETAAHKTIGAITGDEPDKPVTLVDRPEREVGKARVTGPFTVEAVPAPAVVSIDALEKDNAVAPADSSISRIGETRRQSDWRDELLKAGIRGKSGQRIDFSRVEPLPGTRWLHADAETKEASPQRVVASFGPEHAPLEQRQVELALSEAETLRPKPKIIVFAAFQFDPEASKDIDETNWPGVTLLKAQMNADLLTEDLKKKRATNESFWLIGQPDVEIVKIAKAEDKDKYRVHSGWVRLLQHYNGKYQIRRSGQNCHVDAGYGL